MTMSLYIICTLPIDRQNRKTLITLCESTNCNIHPDENITAPVATVLYPCSNLSISEIQGSTCETYRYISSFHNNEFQRRKVTREINITTLGLCQ